MLILGDLACPNKDCAENLMSDLNNLDAFQSNVILCNLEGMIRDDEPYEEEKLFNHSRILDAFKAGKTVFSIANNHTYDYPEKIMDTADLLQQKGFLSCGINSGAIVPVTIQEDDITYAIFVHCWRVYTATNPNTVNNLHIVDCTYEQFYDCVLEYAQIHSEQRVICYFHWNYDLEILPFPAYRKLAHDLIDAGAYAVVGNHAHVPEGGECYKGHAIVYGQGNFYIPSGYYFNGSLQYPEQSKKMMVLELKEKPDDIKCHWYWTDKDSPLRFIKTEDFFTGNILKANSPYQDMDDKTYLDFFKKNRVKNKMVPLFKEYQGKSYRLDEFAAITRIKLIKKIKR